MDILCDIDDSGRGHAAANVAAQRAHGIGGELTLTNVTAAAARELDALVDQVDGPVVVVPPGRPPAIGDGVAVAYESSRTSAGAVAVAASLATALGTRLTVIHVLADPRSYTGPVLPMHRAARADVEAALDGEALALRHVSAYRLPAVHLARTLAEVKPALLVVAAPRPSWRDRLRRSVGSQLVRSASCPVVLVPPGAAIRAKKTTVAMAA